MIQTLNGIESSASALSAERVRMEVITQNIANANTTRGLDGKPFQRQQVVFQSVLDKASGVGTGTQRVEVSRIEKDQRPPRLVYDPFHPDANADGMVAYPDISIHQEMVDYIVASRAYEANLAVVKNARSMALQTLAIGKR
jgi:flagellar basal-body rod protein FlgC